MAENKCWFNNQRTSFIKRTILFIVLFSLVSPIFSRPIHAQEPMLPEASIFVDNKPIKTKYIMREGHLLVPALFLKHTGVKVDRNEKYRSVVFSYGNTMFALPIGKDYSDDYVKAKGTWKRSSLTMKSVEFEGKVFVPLIDVVKKLGMQVKYDTKTNRTFVTTNIPPAKGFINKGNPTGKLVALTFDDGPDHYYTPKILDILKKKHVKATFFVMGKRVKQYPDMLKRIVKEGHGIANHTWSHPRLPKITTSEVVNEVTSTQDLITSTVGRKPDLIRPPFREVTKSDLLVLDNMGFRVIGWSVDTLDWSGKSAEDILATVQKEISPGGIILQHNFQPETGAKLLEGTVEALPKIIDNLRKQGYQFVTVQTMLDNQVQK